MMNVQKSARILIADDDELNLKVAATLLIAEGYDTLVARSGIEAVSLAQKQKPDLILLDVMMPEGDGFDTVARLKADRGTRPIPVIMLTILNDRASKLKALEAGAEEFLSKPIDRADLKIRVRNLLRLKEYSDFLADHNRILNEQVRLRTAQLEAAYRDTVLTLVSAAEHKDNETGHHVRRISHYCRLLAQAMDLPQEFQEAIFQSSPMHDIGKIGIPDHILLKTGVLTPEEWRIMQTHSALGAQILASGTSPYARVGADIALNHHERWDGSGYPNGIKGVQIPLAARIMQICDVYDALRSARPYKLPIAHADAVRIISDGDGRTQPGHFDPVVLDYFMRYADFFSEVYDQHIDG